MTGANKSSGVVDAPTGTALAATIRHCRTSALRRLLVLFVCCPDDLAVLWSRACCVEALTGAREGGRPGGLVHG